MNSKKPKEEILEMLLSEFEISKLTIWMNRPKQQYEENLKRWTVDDDGNKLVGDELEKAIQKADSVFQKELEDQPVTVGELMGKYQYQFPGRNRCGLSKLGKKSIDDFKAKLVKFGLTPDDWPALVVHGELLLHLSKTAILKIPITEILNDPDVYLYLGCTKEDVASKTVRDFIQFNPLDISDWHSFQGRFFRKHRRWFVTFRQRLLNKGFGLEDGQFFSWDPEFDSLDKVIEILGKYKLEPSELQKFAKIVVAERWVV